VEAAVSAIAGVMSVVVVVVVLVFVPVFVLVFVVFGPVFVVVFGATIMLSCLAMASAGSASDTHAPPTGVEADARNNDDVVVAWPVS